MEERKTFVFSTLSIFFLLFEQGASSFHFTLGPPNYVASPAYILHISLILCDCLFDIPPLNT